MSFNEKRVDRCIEPERIGCIAEQGIDAIRLTGHEKQVLVSQGLEELYAVWEFERQEVPSLNGEAVSLLMGKFFPATGQPQPVDLWIKLGNHLLETIRQAIEWRSGSAAFAARETSSGTISFNRTVGKFTIHLEVVRRDERLADINIKVSDNSDTKTFAFDAELLKSGQCVEMIHTTKDIPASFYAVEVDNYVLRVSDAKKEIASIALRMET